MVLYCVFWESLQLLLREDLHVSLVLVRNIQFLLYTCCTDCGFPDEILVVWESSRFIDCVGYKVGLFGIQGAEYNR